MIVSVVCFAMFLLHDKVRPDGQRPQQRVPTAAETKAAFNVGLPSSPWLSYKTDDSQPLSGRFSGFEIHPLSVSWLLLIFALAASTAASLPAIRFKTQPVIGNYWTVRGNCRRALAAYEKAIQMNSEDFPTLNNLAWILGTCPEPSLRDGKRAVVLATKVCEFTEWSDPACIDTLAAAHAEAGDFQAAIASQRKAIAMLPAGNPKLERYHARLNTYEANKPFHECSKHTEQARGTGSSR